MSACGAGSRSEPAPVLDAEFACHVFYRSSVTKPPDNGEVVTVSKNGDVVRVEREQLEFKASYFDDPYDDGRALKLHVTEHGREVVNQLYQLPRDALPSNSFFRGGHGFTGLAYAYSVSAAEMQFWCEARALSTE